ncbi:TIGR03087 family PEP-CTERM/XrtA system glycosyltransferase [Magnetococcales bacterium HHB-1]
MEDLLLLVHRIPYPPNKGDKIRSYPLFRYLCKRYRVHLGTFIDDPKDLEYLPLLTEMVEEAGGEHKILRLHPHWAKIKALSGLLTGKPLTIPYYASRTMTSWVKSIVEKYKISHAVAYSSAVAPFLLDRPELKKKVLDFVDVDSQKWRQYAEKKQGLSAWIYRREAELLLQYEQMLAEAFSVAFFVSQQEAEIFKQLSPQVAKKVDYWENGVDHQRFSPEERYENPYPPEDKTLVFTGAMDYWANVEAVSWFAEQVFPEIQQQVPLARFIIVGGNPTEEVKKLADYSGITVTGRVDDVRPYLAYATAVVAPLRIAQGVQNKVLEAMSMGKVVLATEKAMEGINAPVILKQTVSDDPIKLASFAVRILKGEDPMRWQMLGDLGREVILKNYRWSNNLRRVGKALEKI